MPCKREVLRKIVTKEKKIWATKISAAETGSHKPCLPFLKHYNCHLWLLIEKGRRFKRCQRVAHIRIIFFIYSDPDNSFDSFSEVSGGLLPPSGTRVLEIMEIVQCVCVCVCGIVCRIVYVCVLSGMLLLLPQTACQTLTKQRGTNKQQCIGRGGAPDQEVTD